MFRRQCELKPEQPLVTLPLRWCLTRTPTTGKRNDEVFVGRKRTCTARTLLFPNDVGHSTALGLKNHPAHGCVPKPPKSSTEWDANTPLGVFLCCGLKTTVWRRRISCLQCIFSSNTEPRSQPSSQFRTANHSPSPHSPFGFPDQTQQPHARLLQQTQHHCVI